MSKKDNRGTMLDRYLMQKYRDNKPQQIMVADSDMNEGGEVFTSMNQDGIHHT